MQATSGGEDGFSWPHNSEGLGSLVVPRDNGTDKARCNSADGVSSSTSTSNIKLPRPRSWMSNLLGVATTPLARQRHHSYDDQQSQGCHLMPVSSLVLQDEQSIAKKNSPLPPLPLGNLQAASRSTPDLSSPSVESGTFSRRKPVALVVRNLDTSPRGAFTPTIPPFAQQSPSSSRSKTAPWSTFEKDLRSREELIDPEEEETMIHNAVAEKRRQGAMAGEERAVLDMLDQMNNSVDTFERPLVSRAQSRADSLLPRFQGNATEDKQGASKDVSPTQPLASISPTRLSVKAFASALDEYDSSSRSSSPVRGGSSSPVRMTGRSSAHFSSSSNNSSIGRQGGVKRVIEEREKLDLGSKDFLSPPADPPARLAYLRQDSASTVASYASQTNAFLNRRATHAADKRITHSPSPSNVSSSGHGSSTTFWSKKGYTTESPITSPELPSGSEDKCNFRFDSTRAREASERPFFRRMRTDETDNTSLESFVDTPFSSKQSSTTTHRDTTVQVQTVRAIDFATLKSPATEAKPAQFKPASQRGSCVSTAVQQTNSSSPFTTPKRTSAHREVTYTESGVTPGQVDSPKKGARDLIRFFEQTSAPNSPQQSPSRSRTNTPAALKHFKEALSSSVNDNRLASPSPFAAASGAIQQQSSPGKAGRSRPWKGAAAEAEAKQSSDDASEVFGNQENLPLSAMRSHDQIETKRPVSGSFFARLRKVPGGESDETAESPRRSGSGQIKTGIDRLVTTLSPPIKKTSNEAGCQAAAEAEMAEGDKGDRESVVSSRSIGTTRSLRQTAEVDGDLDLNPHSTMMGQPGATAYRTGLVYYFNVHASNPVWQWAQAVLLPSAVALSWIPAGGGRDSLVLDLVACREVHSVHGPSHPSSLDDIGAKVAREQNLNQICPWQLVFDDGVERMAVDSASDRVQWVNAVR